MDPDFQRLMQGTVTLRDLSPDRQHELELKTAQGTFRNEDLDLIKDQSTREMMKRWAGYFK